MTAYTDPGHCWACGDRLTFGPHYHEPECPGCGADLLDEDDVTTCCACGADAPVAKWIAAAHRARGNLPPTTRAALAALPPERGNA